ncbi:hypothetical protein GTY86_35680 [Streptomyces sp. SID5770]|nr:hypothetical protein [Streptomyces sp. SID5770]MZE53794.1 hypothetical protein [Streptomyces sp. SID5770]MZE56517.1 hypothetical protein [Streptomyces sp. SID5770]
MTRPGPEPLDPDEQAFLDLHAPRLAPPVTRERDHVDQHTETVTLEGDFL